MSCKKEIIRDVIMAQRNVRMYDNASVSSGDVSTLIGTRGYETMEIFGDCTTGTGTISLEVSANNVDWYDTGMNLLTTDGSSFFGHYPDLASEYYRLKFDQNMTGMTLWVCLRSTD